jgi:hypothetical protein
MRVVSHDMWFAKINQFQSLKIFFQTWCLSRHRDAGLKPNYVGALGVYQIDLFVRIKFAEYPNDEVDPKSLI